jgi:CheY-like chemotaxis protein
MSHEIRTPLNGVLGTAELLTETPLSGEQSSYVSTIIRSGESLLDLLNDILDFSKIEAGQLTLESILFDLELLVFDVAELFRSKLEGRPVELLVDFDPDLPRVVQGDPGRIRQVLNNLVSNAIKFTREGHVLIEVRASPPEAGRGFYRLVVADTGIGIEPEKQAKLFRPFVQADSSTTRRFGGTGLGLTLVKCILEAMHGTIALESRPGEGTRLLADLPLMAEGSLPGQAATHLKDKRILVIDDLAINRQVQCRQLEAFGALTVAAPSGEAALHTLEEALDRQEPFDAALVDLHMPPGMDGATFGRLVRHDPRCATTALVVLTSTGVRGESAALASLGFDGYLVKPASGGTLARVLSAAITHATSKTRGGLVTSHTLREAQPASKGSARIRGRILLVEDQEVNQIIARKFLESAGAEVEVAAHGLEALDRLAGNRYDLILMDCQMPEMDGFQATERIRALEDATGEHLPIVAMTAHAMAGDRDRCLAAGMDDYLTKPINRDTLLRAVARWMPTRELPQPESTLSFPCPAPGLGLDTAQFAKLWEVFNHDGREMKETVLDSFRIRGEELLQELRRCQASGAGFRNPAHALKGTARTLALEGLGRIAERIEQGCGTASAETMEGLIQEAEEGLRAAFEFFDVVGASKGT